MENKIKSMKASAKQLVRASAELEITTAAVKAVLTGEQSAAANASAQFTVNDLPFKDVLSGYERC